MLYVSYLRVSTARQGASGLGIEAQRDAVRRFVGTNAGEMAAEFIEIETGKGSNALARRPQLRAALDCAKSKNATLVVAKLDRLTRSARLLLELIEKSGGTEIVFCDLPLIPPGPVGRFMITQLAAVAEFEAGMISERTKAALAAAKARGVRLGANGARLAATRKAQALHYANSVRHEVVLAQRAGCTTLRSVAEHMNLKGIATPSGGRWHPATVQRVMNRLGR